MVCASNEYLGSEVFSCLLSNKNNQEEFFSSDALDIVFSCSSLYQDYSRQRDNQNV